MKPGRTLDSIRIDIDPSPHGTPRTEAGLVWPVVRERPWAPVAPPPNADFRDIIERRRSRRVLSKVPFREIVNLIAFALAPRFENNEGRFRAPPLSAGALHAVDVILLAGRRLCRFDRRGRSLQTLRAVDDKKLVHFHVRTRELLPQSNAAVIVLVGDLPRISSYYADPGSLLFRDAGALLQTLAFATEAFGLGCCPLGLLGREVIEALGLDPTIAIPVGAAVLGYRAPAD